MDLFQINNDVDRHVASLRSNLVANVEVKLTLKTLLKIKAPIGALQKYKIKKLLKKKQYDDPKCTKLAEKVKKYIREMKKQLDDKEKVAYAPMLPPSKWLHDRGSDSESDMETDSKKETTDDITEDYFDPLKAKRRLAHVPKGPSHNGQAALNLLETRKKLMDGMKRQLSGANHRRSSNDNLKPTLVHFRSKGVNNGSN